MQMHDEPRLPRAALQAEEAGHRLMPGEPGVPRQDTRFLAWLMLVALLALVVREHFVLIARVANPFAGDVRDYAAAAWNLAHHGILSTTQPQAAPPLPDAYRPPGYPWLLALCMRLSPGGWYALALQVQVLLGTATVVLTGLLGRAWLPRNAALAAAALLALWPHHIVASGALLSEVLFGFALSAALCLHAHGRLAASGAMFGFATLVNPLIALFPPVLALLQRKHWPRRRLCVFLVLFAIPLVSMLARDASVPPDTHNRPGRLAANLVQGSWPLYHAARNDALLGKPIPIAIMRQIDDDARLMDRDPAAGLARLGTRMARDPAGYAAWYALRKPWLLWEWNIRVGIGGPYFLVVRNSPLEREPVLHAITSAYRIATPLLALLMAVGVVAIGIVAVRGRAPSAALATALLVVYLTAVHAILQSEPRYANAYRGFEALMAVAGVLALGQVFVRRRDRGSLPSHRAETEDGIGPDTRHAAKPDPPESDAMRQLSR
jgi:hypothetical protein